MVRFIPWERKVKGRQGKVRQENGKEGKAGDGKLKYMVKHLQQYYTKIDYILRIMRSLKFNSSFRRIPSCINRTIL